MLTSGMKQEAWRTWRDTIRTRADLETPWVMICTRAASDDLAGRVMALEPEWEVIRSPALKEDGTPAWPFEKETGKGHTVEWLLEQKNTDPLTHLTQFQALPPSIEGDVLHWRDSWLSFHRPHPTEVIKVYQSWDTASTMQARRSKSANVGITGLFKTNGHLYIDDVYKEQKAPAQTSNDMATLFEKSQQEWGDKTHIIVENKSSGTALVSFLQSFSSIGHHIREVNIPGGGIGSGLRGQLDPINRFAAVSHIFENGLIELPYEWRPWKDAYIEALTSFPNGEQGEHNDQVLAPILLLEHVFPSHGFIAPYMGPIGTVPGWTH